MPRSNHFRTCPLCSRGGSGLILSELTVVLVCVSVVTPWVRSEIHRRKCERVAASILQNDYDAFVSPDYFGRLDLHWNALRSGVLFWPVDGVSLSDCIVDQRAMDQIREFRFLQSVFFENTVWTCRCRLACKDFKELIAVDLVDTHLNSAQIDTLLTGCSIESLRLTRVGDAGRWLRQLHRVPNLRNLTLEEVRIGQRGIRDLGRLSQLEFLCVAYAKDAHNLGLALQHLANLQELGVIHTPLNDEDMFALHPKTPLRLLWLIDTDITDEGLRVVGELSCLKQLILDGNRITDRGIANLARLRTLEQLGVARTNVTNRSLRVFNSLPRLRWVIVEDTKIDPFGDGFLGILKGGFWYPESRTIQGPQ